VLHVEARLVLGRRGVSRAGVPVGARAITARSTLANWRSRIHSLASTGRHRWMARAALRLFHGWLGHRSCAASRHLLVEGRAGIAAGQRPGTAQLG